VKAQGLSGAKASARMVLERWGGGCQGSRTPFMAVPSARRSAACGSSSGTGTSLAEVAKAALANPSVKRCVDPRAIRRTCRVSGIRSRAFDQELDLPIDGDSPSSGG
jgi:hypothetical protein